MLCPSLPPPSLESAATLLVNGYLEGETAVYSCNEGFNLYASDSTGILPLFISWSISSTPALPYTRTCTSGVWSGYDQIECKALGVCPALEAPEYGSIDISGYNDGDTAVYGCPAYQGLGAKFILGYDPTNVIPLYNGEYVYRYDTMINGNLVDESTYTRICQDGVWSGHPVIQCIDNPRSGGIFKLCSLDSILDNPAPDAPHLTKSIAVGGESLVRYECDLGYVAQGTDITGFLASRQDPGTFLYIGVLLNVPLQASGKFFHKRCLVNSFVGPSTVICVPQDSQSTCTAHSMHPTMINSPLGVFSASFSGLSEGSIATISCRDPPGKPGYWKLHYTSSLGESVYLGECSSPSCSLLPLYL